MYFLANGNGYALFFNKVFKLGKKKSASMKS